MRKIVPAVFGVVVLSGCSDVQSAVDEVGATADKASVCAEALGLVNLNPNVDLDTVQAEAGEKANQLRELANQVADRSVRDNLLALADGYVELERRQAEHLGNANDWIQRNLANLDRLRQACM